MRNFAEQRAVAVYPVPSERSAYPFPPESCTDAHAVILERAHKAEVLADGIDHADCSLPGYYPVALAHAVLPPLADYDIVVLGVVADLVDGGRDIGEAGALRRDAYPCRKKAVGYIVFKARHPSAEI